MSRPLEGKVALVTGASRGIGAAVARAYSGAGAAVALAARDAAALDRVAHEINETGGNAIAVPTDVTDADSVAYLVEQAVSAFGRLDVACNNAAFADHRPTLLADISVDRFDAALAVNLRGVFLVTQAREYSRIGFNSTDGAFATVFFCLTGLHGAHVFVGLSLLFGQGEALACFGCHGRG